MIRGPLKDVLEISALMPCIEVGIRLGIILHPWMSDRAYIRIAHDELP